MQVPPGHFPPPPPGPSPFVSASDGSAPAPPGDVFESRTTPVVLPPVAPVPLPPVPTPPGTAPVVPTAQLGEAQGPVPGPPTPPLVPTAPMERAPVAGLAPGGGQLEVGEGAMPDGWAPGAPLPLSPVPPLAATPQPAPTGPISVSTMSKIPPPRRGRGLLIGLGVCVFFGVLVLGAVLTARPWLARPEDDAKKIERRFREVRELAKLPRQPATGAKDAALVGAALLAREWVPKPATESIPTQNPKKLDKGLREAIEGVAKWARGHGNFATAGCVAPTGEFFALPAASGSVAGSGSAAPMPSVAPTADSPGREAQGQRPSAEAYYRLGRLTLETASKERRLPISVRGVLRLAHMMRARGNLDEYVAGLRLARDAALWSKTRKQSADAAFQTYRPRPTQLRAALARHAICSVALLDGLEGWHFDVGTRFPGATSGPLLGLVSYEREVLVLEDFHGKALHGSRRAHTVGDVLQGYTQASRPQSVVLEVTLPDAARFEEIAKLHEAYDRLQPLSRQRPSPRPSRPKARRPGDQRREVPSRPQR